MNKHTESGTLSGATQATGYIGEGSIGGYRENIGFTPDLRRFTKYLAFAALVLAVVGTIANIVIYQVAESPDADIARIMTRFDLGHEPSLPAWFSSIVLLLNSTALITIGLAERKRGSADAIRWLVLGVIFFGLSIDESVMFHEMINKAIGFVFVTSGFLLFPWAVVGFAFAAIVGLLYLPFLLRLERRIALLFIASGAIFVGGAVGMEFFAGNVIDQHGVASLSHTFVQAIEETMEMLGAILFLYALTGYWRETYGEFRIGSSLNADETVQ